MSSFETFITSELPKRSALETVVTTSYDGDPNDGGAPAALQGAPLGSWFREDTAGIWWRKKGSGPTDWEVAVGALGPATSTDNGVAVFDGTGGAALKDPDASVDFGGQGIANVGAVAGHVPTTRNISNGTGISGGGDLSADRTLSVDQSALDPASMSSGSALDDQIPTADGLGGIAWETPAGGGTIIFATEVALLAASSSDGSLAYAQDTDRFFFRKAGAWKARGEFVATDTVTAIGSAANSERFGAGASAAGNGSSFGASATSALGGSAFGKSANAGQDAAAVGANANASGPSSTALGGSAASAGVLSTAAGKSASAAPNFSTSFGASASVAAGADNGVALGYLATVQATGGRAVAIGSNTTCGENDSVCIGYLATVPAPASGNSDGSVAIGRSATCGSAAGAGVDGATAVGERAEVQAGATNGVALGVDTEVSASAVGGVAVGPSAKAAELGAVALGEAANVGVDRGIAIGAAADIPAPSSGSSNQSVCIGYSCEVGTGGAGGCGQSVLIGSTSEVDDGATSVIALGSSVFVKQADSIAIGRASKISSVSSLDSIGSMAIGAGARIGSDGSAGCWASIAVGENATVGFGSYNCVAIGPTATINSGSSTGAVAIGLVATCGSTGAVALGQSSSATANYGVAIGRSASVTHADAVAIGRSAISTAANRVTLGTLTGGGVGKELQVSSGFAAWSATPPGSQPAKVTDPTGGSTIDAEARTAINSLIDIIEGAGLAAAV